MKVSEAEHRLALIACIQVLSRDVERLSGQMEHRMYALEKMLERVVERLLGLSMSGNLCEIGYD